MKFQRFTSYFLLAFAVFMRLLSYWRNRSLFYDEINLARNYAEKDYLQLLGHLNYNQHAPPFFNWVVKFSTDILGMNEYALRLFPFVAGVVSIFLFYKIAQRFLSDFSLWFALILFGFSSYLLEYGTEVKQYSTDVFWACLLVYTALKVPFQGYKSGIFWAILGALTIWFSMPAVFILVGVGFHFALLIYQQNAHLFFSQIKGLLLCIGLWLVSFALLYQLNLLHSLSSTHLKGFHDQFFLKINNLTQSGEIIIGIIRSIVGHTTVPIIFAFLCFFVGVFHLYQRQKEYFILLFSPILVCLLASFLQQYSLIIRLTVFLFPAIILLISIGLSTLYAQSKQLPRKSKNIFIILLAGLSISCMTERSALKYLYQPLVKEDARTVLEKLTEKNLSNSRLVVTICGKPSFLFYTKYYTPTLKIDANQVIIQEEKESNEHFFAKFSSDSTWIFDSHTFGQAADLLQEKINQKGNIRDEISSKNAWAISLGNER